MTGGDTGERREAMYRELLALRRTEIVPRLTGARSIGACVVGSKAVVARWQMGDDAVLTLAVNLAADESSIAPPAGSLLYATSADAGRQAAVGLLVGPSCSAFLDAGQATNE